MGTANDREAGFLDFARGKGRDLNPALEGLI
jgi:hypothetical protein